MPWARAAAVEKGMWEPGSGFEILVGLDMGCNKQQTDKGDSGILSWATPTMDLTMN